MTATFIKNMGKHRITLSRSEAETLAYSGARYSILLAALDVFKDSNEFNIYGSLYDVKEALNK